MRTTPQVILSEPATSDADNRLREFAHSLAKTHTVEVSRLRNISLLKHLQNWEELLQNANAIFKAVPPNNLPVSHAREWMLDNFYVVKQTFRQIEEGLPASFFDQLPKLDRTLLKGHPRIFAVAWEWIGYSQGQIDLTQAAAFIQVYQQVTPLTIGELWALPIMLRIGILELLVFAATELTGMDAPKSLSDIPNRFASPALANDAIVTNCFLSLRLLSATDWKTFFEQTSRVEHILRDDPAGIYPGMDFDTRNSYRNVVEELARHSSFNEEQVALAAIEFARGMHEKTQGRKAHVGYYLRDSGRSTLENTIHYQTGFRVRLQRALLASPTITYLGSIAILSVLFLTGLLIYTKLVGGSLAQTIIAGLLGCWVGFGRCYCNCALEYNPSYQTPKPAALGFFRGYRFGQPHNGGRSNLAR